MRRPLDLLRSNEFQYLANTLQVLYLLGLVGHEDLQEATRAYTETRATNKPRHLALSFGLYLQYVGPENQTEGQDALWLNRYVKTGQWTQDIRAPQLQDLQKVGPGVVLVLDGAAKNTRILYDQGSGDFYIYSPRTNYGGPFRQELVLPNVDSVEIYSILPLS